MSVTTHVARDMLADVCAACTTQMISITIHDDGSMTFDRHDDLAPMLESAGLPVADPHGTLWCTLSERELNERADWCMRPAMHDALDMVRAFRATR